MKKKWTLRLNRRINYLFVYLENKLFVLVRVERQLNSFTYLQMTILYFFLLALKICFTLVCMWNYTDHYICTENWLMVLFIPLPLSPAILKCFLLIRIRGDLVSVNVNKHCNVQNYLLKLPFIISTIGFISKNCHATQIFFISALCSFFATIIKTHLMN